MQMHKSIIFVTNHVNHMYNVPVTNRTAILQPNEPGFPHKLQIFGATGGNKCTQEKKTVMFETPYDAWVPQRHTKK